ncbi:hypothetical protein [Paenibacillus sp. GCM10027626]
MNDAELDCEFNRALDLLVELLLPHLKPKRNGDHLAEMKTPSAQAKA